MYNEAPTISTPEDVKKKIEPMATKTRNPNLVPKDINDVANKYTDAAKKSMKKKDPGCLDAYNKAAEQLEKFDFKKFFGEQMKNDPVIAKVLKG